jgi:uncharacterized protein (TIGR03067 family)
MNRALMILPILALLTGCAAASDERQSASQSDLERLQGIWRLESEVIDGQKQPAAPVKTRMTYTGHHWVQAVGAEATIEGSSELRPDRVPKEIDISPSSGPGAGLVLLGIYRLSDDTYESCFVLPGNERPTDFTSEPNAGRHHVVFKREKP